ncbi:GNAT family N-acetyltransferase [Acinetobacter sp. UBA1297]|uniref:GNAT family N-acetyltransferase n=1 Tax=Acinetobacter sp. UBA1297 TaxID=1945925 RepID=UPI002579EA8C|nr:GNAT family protein [Acinetobacter sp. UBA1297]
MQIQKLSRQHLETRYQWLNHEKIFQHMNMQYPITLEETETWYGRVITNNRRIDLIFFEDDQIVAMTGLTDINSIDGIAEFYIMVNPEAQSKGYGKKATIFTLNYAFLNFNIHKVYLYTNSFNERANSLYGNLGFSLEGKLRKHKFKNGQHIDRCIYGLLKEDWISSNYYIDNIFLEI